MHDTVHLFISLNPFFLMEPTEGFILAESKDPDPRASQTEDREH